MELYRFDKETGKRITKFNSDFVMSRIIQTEKNAHVGCMHLEANGVIGYSPGRNSANHGYCGR